jgi:hypothetical protein
MEDWPNWGDCRLNAPTPNTDDRCRGVWPRTQEDDGCHEGIDVDDPDLDEDEEIVYPPWPGW